MSSARSLAALSLASILGACASAGSAPPEQVAMTPSTVRVETASGVMEARTTGEDRSTTSTLKLPLTQAWSQIASVYADLGLPVNGYVDATRQITSKGTRLRGHLGKLRMSQLVTCGTDITGEEKSNSYEVALDVASALGVAPNNETHIMTMVTANARPMATSGDPVRCVSTGALERRIALALTLRGAGASAKSP